MQIYKELLVPYLHLSYLGGLESPEHYPYIIDVPPIHTKSIASSFLTRTAKEWNTIWTGSSVFRKLQFRAVQS